MMSSRCKGSESSPVEKWDRPIPDLKAELPGKVGEIDQEVLKNQFDYVKVHHRSDELLSHWNRHDKATTFEETTKADLVRLALIDVIHQRQFQKRAIKANITDTPWNSISPEYAESHYGWLFAGMDKYEYEDDPIGKANIHAEYPSTPITVTDYGESNTIETMTRKRIENPTDFDLGFPSLFPVGPELSSYSWFASIDRLPAHLFSKKICRRGYEYVDKPLIIQNLIGTYEQSAIEKRDNNRNDIANNITHDKYIKPTYEGNEVMNPLLQDVPCTIEQINKSKQRRLAFKMPTSPDNAQYPLHFWSFSYLAHRTREELAEIKAGIDKIELNRRNGTTTDDDDNAPPPHPFAEAYFRIGEDDDGNNLRVHLKSFIQYILTNKDDSPLYLFESNLYHSQITSRIPLMFHPPTYFVADIVRDVMKIHERPPFSWQLIGAQRSGTRCHTDPRSTSAWNMSIVGCKRWVLMRPGVPLNIAKGTIVMTESELRAKNEFSSPQTVYWFEHVLPRLRRFIYHREQKRRAILLGLDDLDESEQKCLYTCPFVQRGDTLCQCGQGYTHNGTKSRYREHNRPDMVCSCQCLCGCKVHRMTEELYTHPNCSTTNNSTSPTSSADGTTDIIAMDPCTTVDDQFGTNVWCLPPHLQKLEQQLYTKYPSGHDENGLTIQQKMDIAIAEYKAFAKDTGVKNATALPSSSLSSLVLPTTSEWNELRDGYGFMEFIQYPGETILVPSGWHHAVINVTDTIAVTENFANDSNFDTVLRYMRKHNKSATRRWLYRLEQASKGNNTTITQGTNDGRDIDEKMTPQQAKAWYTAWYNLALRINKIDGFKLSKFKPSEDPSTNARYTESDSNKENVTESLSSSWPSSFTTSGSDAE